MKDRNAQPMADILARQLQELLEKVCVSAAAAGSDEPSESGWMPESPSESSRHRVAHMVNSHKIHTDSRSFTQITQIHSHVHRFPQIHPKSHSFIDIRQLYDPPPPTPCDWVGFRGDVGTHPPILRMGNPESMFMKVFGWILDGHWMAHEGVGWAKYGV